MMNEGKKDPNKEEKLEKEEYPLSPADWIVFLGGEISDRRIRILMFEAMIMASVLACLGGVIALMGGDTIESISSGLLVVLAIGSFALLVRSVYRVNQKVRHLEEIREDVICGKLENYEDILKRCEKLCEDAGIFKHEKD